MRLFRNDLQRDVQHFIHTSDITKSNSNVHFILGITVYACPGLTVNGLATPQNLYRNFFGFLNVKLLQSSPYKRDGK